MARNYEFLNHLSEVEEVKKERERIMEEYPDFTFKPRMFHQIQFNQNIRLSIQASTGHYCFPRLHLEDLSKYESFEIAVFDKKGFTSLKKVLDVEIEHLDDVYGYMPIELVENIFQLLKIKYGLLEV